MVTKMRNLLIILSLTLFTLATPIGISTANAQKEAVVGTDGFADLAERLLPSVVNISSTHKPVEVEDFPDMPHFPPGSPFEDFFEEFMDRRGMGMPAVPPASLGSGFVIDAENGYIVTNNHVVKDADEVRVTFHDDVTVEAEVIGRDEKIDLAVLKIQTDHAMVAVPFGNSDELRIGNWIIAIGNPFGLGGSVTAGIVSAQQRDIQSGPYDDFIQTDASINRGNSGGPMFNLKGEVIGINTAIFSPSGGSVGIGFAIPSNLAKPVIRQLIEFGRTRRGWLGVRIQSVTDEIADSLGLSGSKGALVASTTKDGPAEAAGLEAGDIILDFNGKKINEMRDLPRVVAETPIGEEASVTYWRDGKEHKAKVKIGELEKAEEEGLVTEKPREEPKSDGLTVDSVGLVMRDILPMDREQYNIDDETNGVLVSDVTPMSEAAEKGLSAGDVIVEINQKTVEDAVKAKDIIEKAEKGGRSSVLLLVNRDNDVRFVALRLK
ncbi:MAG TPA: DegQ family serine endoprotease [Micavibrio sp.]|nr:DegQ family serine endoprotease [Micavibrio sp.]